MTINAIKYLAVLTIPAGVIHTFSLGGAYPLIPWLYVFVLVPLLELILAPSSRNHTPETEKAALEMKIFDLLLTLMVPIQLIGVISFYMTFPGFEAGAITVLAYIMGMGLLCGVIGINVAHELGHRVTVHEQHMARILLLTSFYMHFIVEHNRGHHKHVATPKDPATATFNQSLYGFWMQSILGGYRSAWNIDREIRKKRGLGLLHSEMFWYHVIQIGLILLSGGFLGWSVTLAYIGAAIVGILLLETVNYIEHYGLQRRQLSDGRYERVQPFHSWNSNHPIGRVFLFELSRHSDHHYLASRKYQILRHFDDSPQLPTGYPGMMVLSLVPPLWFRVMNPEVKKWEEKEMAGEK